MGSEPSRIPRGPPPLAEAGAQAVRRTADHRHSGPDAVELHQRRPQEGLAAGEPGKRLAAVVLPGVGSGGP